MCISSLQSSIATTIDLGIRKHLWKWCTLLQKQESSANSLGHLMKGAWNCQDSSTVWPDVQHSQSTSTQYFCPFLTCKNWLYVTQIRAIWKHTAGHTCTAQCTLSALESSLQERATQLLLCCCWATCGKAASWAGCCTVCRQLATLGSVISGLP